MTMTASTPSPASPASPPPAATPPPSAPERTTAASRAQSLRERLEASEGPATAPEPAAADEASSSTETTTDASAPAASSETTTAADPAAQARADRMARIRAMQERERAKDSERQQHRQRKDQEQTQSQELETLRAQLKELQTYQAAAKDPVALLELAARNEMSVEDLAKAMRERLADPTSAAKHHAKSEADKLRAEIAEVRAELARRDQAAAAERARLEAQQEAERTAYTFLSQAEQRTSTHPLTAQLLRRHGPQGLVAFANQFVAPLLGESYTLDELHDHTEQLLDELQVGHTPAPVNGNSPPNPKSTGAEQPVTTLSGALASERTTVAEEVPLARLPKAERIARAKAKG